MNCRVGSILCSIFALSAPLHGVSPYISNRSQSVDAVRDIVGMTDKINLYDMENLYVVGALTLEGTRSFDADSIAHNLFGINRHTNTTTNAEQLSIDVSGSLVPNRGANDWLADYFGLPTTFSSTLFFKPRISNIILDFACYVGLDEWVEGLYFRAHAPIVCTRWGLNFFERVNNILPLQGYPAGYFAPAAVVVPANPNASPLLSQASEFFSDQDVPTLAGVTFQPLRFARFEQTRQQKTALAEIQMALGYNFISCPCYHLGLNFRVYAPTGNRPDGIYAFQPIVGNGKHWEVGAGFTSHYTFWESDDEESSFGVYIDGNFTHLCSTTQIRTFDLVGKPNSRYMLAEQLGTPVTNLFANPAQGTAAGSTVPSAQFKGVYTPVANITTIPVKVSAAIQADIVANFNYSCEGLSVDVGYNFWAVSCDKIVPRKNATLPDGSQPLINTPNMWALKGDAQVYGFVATDAVTNPPAPSTAIALSATESGATIHSGSNLALGATPPSQNPGIDNPQFAFFTNLNNTDQLTIQPGQASGAATQQRTSNDPIFLSAADIDFASGRTRGLSNKVYAHISYTWLDCDDWIPFLGVGGKAEFAGRHGERECNGMPCSTTQLNPNIFCQDCRGCQRTNVSEWGVWIKGGLFFN